MIQPLSKLVNGKSRADEKRERRSHEAMELRLSYAVCDERDQDRCRVCKRRISIRALSMQHKTIHHHLVHRSKCGSNEPRNILSICCDCNAKVHVEGTMHLEGDADLRDIHGSLCGVRVSRLEDETWTVWKFV
jgi:HNH endonuclease